MQHRKAALPTINFLIALGALILITAESADAWVLIVKPGQRTIGLTVGDDVAAGTPNIVSVTVPAAVLGTGAAQAMTSDSTQANSPFDNFTVCVPPNQVYIGGYLREPKNTANSATLSVTTPAILSNGSEC